MISKACPNFTRFYLTLLKLEKNLQMALIPHCFSAEFCKNNGSGKELSWFVIVLLGAWQNLIRDGTGSCPSGVV